VTSNAAFKANFAKLIQRAGDKAETVVRMTVISMARSCIAKSPVDTGRFRGNWQFGIGAANTANGSPSDKSGGASEIRIVNGVMSAQMGTKLFVTNSLPYARRLEYGHSKQAPQGMVRLTVRETNQFCEMQLGAFNEHPSHSPCL